MKAKLSEKLKSVESRGVNALIMLELGIAGRSRVEDRARDDRYHLSSMSVSKM